MSVYERIVWRWGGGGCNWVEGGRCKDTHLQAFLFFTQMLGVGGVFTSTSAVAVAVFPFSVGRVGWCRKVQVGLWGGYNGGEHGEG